MAQRPCGSSRQQEAGPVLEKRKPYWEANRGRPKSPWGPATSYTLGLWTRRTRYRDDGRVELDNNLIEHARRPVAIGRQNDRFAGCGPAGSRGLFALGPVHAARR